MAVALLTCVTEGALATALASRDAAALAAAMEEATEGLEGK